jgi:DNA-binding Lrp family transcriptional regulator
MRLDRTDREIVRILMKDARRTNRDVAAEIGIAPSTLSERLQRLQRNGVFRGYHADVEPSALGIGLQAMIAIRLRRHAESEVDAFRAHAEAMSEVVELFHVTGANDFYVHVVVRDADHLRNLAVSGFTTLPEVAHIETALVFEHRSKPALPDLS